MPRRILDSGLLLLVCLGLGCTTNTTDDRIGSAGGKADGLTTSICDFEFNAFEQRGIGEIGEADSDPRSTANQTAADLNTDIDCQNEIDRCMVPSYFVDEEETSVLVEIANSEIVGARQLFIDFELAFEQRGSICTVCAADSCITCDPEVLQSLESCVGTAQENEPGLSRADAIVLCIEDTNGSFHALCEESDNFDCGEDFDVFAEQLPACQAELESADSR